LEEGGHGAFCLLDGRGWDRRARRYPMPALARAGGP
jgi:hypothetical protein